MSNLLATVDFNSSALCTLRGHVDSYDGSVVRGCALYSDAPVCLDIVVNGRVVALTYADVHRSDLAAAGVGDGYHGFSLDLRLDRAATHTIEVRRSADGAVLARSSWLVAPAAAMCAA